ncbi:MAG: hypothetical protein IH914_07240, partial [candidate division Zixibacteria bacterium]|nr:hypothetical protein [candidate division Zixibacteria bacterium]
MSATPIPPGAVFTDNGDGTGAFAWTPDFTQAGSYLVTFTATDGVLTDAEQVTISVVEAGNQTPVLAAIGLQTTTEGTNLNFGVSAVDPDGVIPILTVSGLPPGASFIVFGDGTGTFDWTPNFTQAGVFNVIFVASDGLAADSESVTITVNEAGNQTPALAVIGAQSVSEGANLNFTVSAIDPDGTIPAMSAAPLPIGATYIDNGNGTATFNWTPDFTQAGTYSVTFVASDGIAADSELVSITVGEVGNQAPILSAIGPQLTTENVNLAIALTASDPDGTIPGLSAAPLPPGATFTDNGNGTGSFNWTPDFTQSGSFNVTFTASDGVLLDSEVVTITVLEAGNQTPVLAAIGAQAVTENVNLNFAVSATDADGTFPILTASPLPSGATYTDNGDGSAAFDWTPGFTQSGIFNLTFIATDGALADSELVVITVGEAGNQAPTLANIGLQATTEGVNLNFTVTAADADGSTPSLSASSLPTGATFTDNLDGTGIFDWTPDFTQGGTFFVIFVASDGLLADSELVTITVNEEGNQAPVLAAIGPKSVDENVNLSFGVSATDPDATTPGLSATDLPAGAAFTDNGDGTGSFSWTPGFAQSGIFAVTFIATDGTLSDSEIVQITVNEVGNQAPVLAAIGPQSVTENVSLTFGASATDPDGTIPALTASPLPSGTTFIDNGDGTGSFSWTPNFTQSGIFNVIFVASDGTLPDSELVVITVVEAGNQPPVLAAIGPQGVTENVQLSFGVSASDLDATTPSLSASPLPAGAVFTDNGDGTGTFDWTPDFTQSGVFNIAFVASDGLLADSEVVVINVNEAGNQIPALAAIGAQATSEGVNLNVVVSAVDPDGTIPALGAAPLPVGATFTDNGDGTGVFDWTPDFTQAGSFIVIFLASDGVATDSEVVSITVNESGNQAPTLAAIGAQTINEGAPFSLGVLASDPDGTTPALSASPLPAGATFTDNNNGTGTFNWTPGFTQAGIFFVTFVASDGALPDSELVQITVNEAGNQTPVLALIGSQSVTEGDALNFGVASSDPDGTSPGLTASPLPAGASFTDNGDGTGSFSWTPDFTQSGTYIVTFAASDELAADSEIVTISVSEAGNQSPALAAIGAQTIAEGLNLNFGITATDPDGTTPGISASALPPGAVFVDNGDGSATFAWTPDFTQAGLFSVTFTASDGILSDLETVLITVTESGNQPPVLAAIGAQSTTEGVLLSFAVSSSDPDGTAPFLSAAPLPSGAAFSDNGDGTGSFNWTPDFVQSGTFNITFVATDGALADSEFVVVTVLESGNQAPVLAAIGPKSVSEGAFLTFVVSATDPDGIAPTLSAIPIPTGAVFTDNGDGTGSFDWTPDFTQSGTYNVIVRASDGLVIDSEIVTISVGEAGNQTPVLTAIGPQTVSEGANLNIAISASDLDGTTPALSATANPP